MPSSTHFEKLKIKNYRVIFYQDMHVFFCFHHSDGQQILHRNSQYNHLRVDIDPETRGRGSSQEMARVQGISDQQDEEIVVI